MLKTHRIHRRFPRLDVIHHLRRTVLPHQQHRALRREALMAAIGGHGGHIAGLHDHPCARRAGIFIATVPLNFVTHLEEPLNAIVAVNHGQNMLLRRRTAETKLHYRRERRIPRHLRARQEREQIECMDFVLEARFGM